MANKTIETVADKIGKTSDKTSRDTTTNTTAADPRTAPVIGTLTPMNQGRTPSGNTNADKDGAPITETFGGSPVSSDASAVKSTESTINLANATITVPNDSVQPTAADEPVAPIKPVRDTSIGGRAGDAGIGLIRVDGVDFRYVGLAPARDKDAATETGLAVSSANSTFTPLSEVIFDQSVRVKDPASGEFYYPTTATSWAEVQLNGKSLIPPIEVESD